MKMENQKHQGGATLPNRSFFPLPVFNLHFALIKRGILLGRQNCTPTGRAHYSGGLHYLAAVSDHRVGWGGSMGALAEERLADGPDHDGDHEGGQTAGHSEAGAPGAQPCSGAVRRGGGGWGGGRLPIWLDQSVLRSLFRRKRERKNTTQMK